MNIAFSNGKTLEDIPYYNGYYVDIGEAVLVAYPGYPYIDAMINYGDDLYLTLELDENCTADITLCERGKYLAVQKARDIQYSDEQGEQSDIVFANFRAVNMGELKKDVLYRSASPPLTATVTFIDRGIPYDPLKKADPDVTLSADEREIGGLGIFIAKKVMDSIAYEYKNGQNILRIKKTI